MDGQSERVDAREESRASGLGGEGRGAGGPSSRRRVKAKARHGNPEAQDDRKAGDGSDVDSLYRRRRHRSDTTAP